MTVTSGIVIGNWKMNFDHVEAIHFIQQLGVMMRAEPTSSVLVGVAPPFTDLRSVSSVIDAERFEIELSAQHVSLHEAGSYTGEISGPMLKRLGVRRVIIGHSERREMYHMSDEVVQQTIRACRRHSLAPLVCVGEGLDERDCGESLDFVSHQLRRALEGPDVVDELVVAYEPRWAIGTGQTAEAVQVAEMLTSIRSTLTSLGYLGIPVLYGGSVTGAHVDELVTVGHADGFLVGGASLKADSFHEIVRTLNDCYAGKR